MISSPDAWKTCKRCGHVVQNQIVDGVAQWVHAGTGKMLCNGMFAEPKAS